MLSVDELQTLDRLYLDLRSHRDSDDMLLSYYDTEHAFTHIGLALPPEYRREYDVITSGAAVVVDSVVDRQQMRALVLPGEEEADDRLRAIWDASNGDVQLAMFNRDRRLFGRAFLTVGGNNKNPDLPLIRAESPREMAGLVDERHEMVTAAARFYGVDAMTRRTPCFATLYLPDETVWVEWSPRTGKWVEVDRDHHRMGVVPVFMHLNKRVSGSWVGRTALTRGLRSIIDSSCRNLTNLQFAVESHGIPRIFMTGVVKGDFVDPKTGEPLPVWAAYYNAIHTITNPQAKVGQLTASDLKNFRAAQEAYAIEMSAATGFPISYFGLSTANPPAEGAIVGEEKRLVRTCEAENSEVGMTVGWAAALAYQIATKTQLPGNRVRVDWHNPATPTVAQRMDAVVKAKQSGIVSREGAWDELGWSPARKRREEGYFRNEANLDPEMQLASELIRGTG
ncbi:phage portal protein [Collinsella sp. LCP19S3_C6]|uniref:phage portal protein n=2 Tax=Bacteria TaxID=2 RepID=UPI003F9232C4